MSCSYCLGTDLPGCYCDTSVARPSVPPFNDFSIEWDAAQKVYAEYRRAKRAGDRLRCYALKMAINFPPRRFSEIAEMFAL